MAHLARRARCAIRSSLSSGVGLCAQQRDFGEALWRAARYYKRLRECEIIVPLSDKKEPGESAIFLLSTSESDTYILHARYYHHAGGGSSLPPQTTIYGTRHGSRCPPAPGRI